MRKPYVPWLDRPSAALLRRVADMTNQGTFIYLLGLLTLRNPGRSIPPRNRSAHRHRKAGRA